MDRTRTRESVAQESVAQTEQGAGVLSSAERVAQDYASKLITLSDAPEIFGVSVSTFLRFRRRHGIRILPGQKVHVDDVIKGFERERQK